jgi:hypothetical protein
LVQSSSPPAQVAGVYGGALEFDGVDDVMLAADVPVDTAQGGANTVSLWVKGARRAGCAVQEGRCLPCRRGG